MDDEKDMTNDILEEIWDRMLENEEKWGAMTPFDLDRDSLVNCASFYLGAILSIDLNNAVDGYWNNRNVTSSE